MPFRGTDMAKIALLYSSVFGEDAYQSLLAFMHTERNDTLEEVTNEFMDICHKLLPPIDVFCAYEQVPTVISYGDRLAQKAPTLLKNGFFKAGARRFMEHGFAALGAGKVGKPNCRQAVAHPANPNRSISLKKNLLSCKEPRV